MHLAVLVLAAAEEGAEPSKTPFYLAGGLLVLFGVLVASLGIVKHDFPSGRGVTRAVMAVGVLLVALTMTSAVLTG